ncbi:energy transducer TonB [Mucilaginibacter sp. CSA2-8R]|uniref:energy transducer TonB n=1 Tax=Mucilaginibacter sp. CSA2-8R TaxID=3141542 RepID=UPI00315D922F
MADEIKNIKLKFNCNENWEAMPLSDGGRFCNKCKKKVYDFTDSHATEFAQIMAENNYNICDRFTQQQLAPRPVQIPAWKKWLSAAVVLLGINLFNHKAEAQKAKDNKTTTENNTQNATFGGVTDTDPQYPNGGPEKFKEFIAQHLNKTQTPFKGRITITFVVENDGSLTDIQAIGRSLDSSAAQEAIRVFKLSPKWIPGKRYGKPIRVQYSVPVFFD